MGGLCLNLALSFFFRVCVCACVRACVCVCVCVEVGGLYKGLQHWHIAMTVLVGREAVKKPLIHRDSFTPELTQVYFFFKSENIF